MKRILYVVSRMPAMTHTFIDREIRALTGSGYSITTVSRTSPLENDVSPETLSYYGGTLYLDRVGLFTKLLSQIPVLLLVPLRLIRLLLLIAREEEIASPKERLRLLFYLAEAGYIFVRLRKAGISHVHAHFLKAPTITALFVARYLDVPFSFTMHSGMDIFRDPPMLRTAIALSKKAVTISEYNKRYLTQKYGDALINKVEVVHCGIDTELFKPTPRTRSDLPLILAVGRLIEMKGFRYLLEACKILRDAGSRFRCYIAGNGEELQKLKDQSKALALDGVVTLLGGQLQTQILKMLEEASVFVLPSIVTTDGGCDGIPVALMEAMSMEVAVVSTKIVGIPELIEDRVDGLLVEQRDAEELAAAIRLLLDNPDLRERLAKKGRSKVISSFNIAKVPCLMHPVID